MTLAGFVELCKTVVTIVAACGLLIGAIVLVTTVITGMKCLLRCDMLHTYYKHIDDKTIRQYEKENFELCYAAYRALKGNSFIEDIHKVVSTWQVVS